MKDHELKCWPPYFTAILEKRKCFEYRINDRNFELNDTLFLREWDNIKEEYTGRCMRLLIQSIWSKLPGLINGYCIMDVSILQYWKSE